jgi:hypothetical protein
VCIVCSLLLPVVTSRAQPEIDRNKKGEEKSLSIAQMTVAIVWAHVLSSQLV